MNEFNLNNFFYTSAVDTKTVANEEKIQWCSNESEKKQAY